MKHISFAVVALATVLFSAPANAALVQDLGIVTAGMSGVVDTDTEERTGPASTKFFYDQSTGSLAAGTKITFTYSITTTAASVGNWLANGILGGNEYVSAPGDWLMVSQNGGDKVWEYVLTLSNMTGANIIFSSFLQDGRNLNVATRYTTSAVPLPAALPLFGAGLIGLVGYKRIRKNKA